MAIAITIPRLDWSMEEGTFVEWRKRDGDAIRPGDQIYVLESEKAAQEIEALDSGILRIPADGPSRAR
jgi:pyruvate dehydrogenase E2 component (dihydrolipoamide acetyltransferase)